MSRINFVRLLPNNMRVRPFDHPVTNAPGPPLTPDEERILLEEHFNGNKEARDKLILGYLGLLRNLVGRYLYHWPVTRRFTEEMVSEGLVALTVAIDGFPPEALGEIELRLTVKDKIRHGIESFLSNFRGIVPAPFTVNRDRVADGKRPIYGHVTAGLNSVAESACYEDGNAVKVDVVDTVDAIRQETNIKYKILDEKYWGCPAAEVAKELGVHASTVWRYRRELLDEYKQLIGDEDVE